ncbi:hypothetical protein V8F20_006153 [Naviculisporaceae sp. PSN 640]
MELELEPDLERYPRAEKVLSLHDVLAGKYASYRRKIEEHWRSFNQEQRKQCLKDGMVGGRVLQHSSDESLGQLWMIMPEWNLQDLTKPGSDSLLELLEFRALKTVYDQFREGINSSLGDLAYIKHMMANNGLRTRGDFPRQYGFFLNEDHYGVYITLMPGQSGPPDAFADRIVDIATADLVLLRQSYILQALVIIIDDILAHEEGFPGRPAAMSPKDIRLPHMVDITSIQRDAADGYLWMLRTEPSILAHAVNDAFFSRPELVPGDKGSNPLALVPDRHKSMSSAFFDVIFNAIRTVAVWRYLEHLIEYLEAQASPENKACHAVILREIANVAHLKYSHDKASLKRHVQAGIGINCFKRLPDSQDVSGNPRVVMKGDPAKIARGNKQLQLLLRLCQDETTLSKATECLKSLSELHDKHQHVLNKLAVGVFNALMKLHSVTEFIQQITAVMSLPSVSRNSGQQFIVATQEAETKLNQLKNGFNLADYGFTIDLFEPGMTDEAFGALEHYIVDNTGTKPDDWYQNIIDKCFTSIQLECEQRLDKANSAKTAQGKYIPFPAEPCDTKAKVRVEPRREKLKTRAWDQHITETGPPTTEPVTTEEEQALPPQTFKVSAATAEVFSKLFDKTKARSSISWTSFEAAFAELKFTVVPKFGSVFTFYPPGTMAVNKSLTVHRPHKSHIEGYHIPMFAGRLKRLYGWGEETFVAA